MLDKEKVKEYYLKGLNANQIARILKCKPPTVRKCIERNFKQFKQSNLATKLANKEVDRITRREAKRFMSDETFIKMNKSIYKTDHEGNIILNENIASAISFDAPRELKNRNSAKEIDRIIRKSGYKKDLLFHS